VTERTAAPGRPAEVDAVLDRIRRAPSILAVFALAGELADVPARSAASDRDADLLVEATRDAGDAPTAIAAVHALGRLAGAGGAADDRLAELAGSAGDWLAPHAAWALAFRPPREDAVRGLVGLVGDGRLAGMLAQWTLGRWAIARPELIEHALTGRLRHEPAAEVRARLVETLGLVPGTDAHLATIACDTAEAVEARVAALAAAGDRDAPPAGALETTAQDEGPAADAARFALLDRELRAASHGHPAGPGLRVAQVHLGSRLDPTLTHAGEADTGGIATLLVQLGEALARDVRIAAVTTIGRGPAADALASLEAAGDRHAVVAVPLEHHEGSSFVDPWPARVAAERGLRRILRLRRPGIVHLRMADVGSLAACRVARSEGVPTVFTLAPDPHSVIAGMERAGELDRASFGPADARANYWFRAWLVDRLARGARQVVLFPRPALAATLRDLVGIDVEADPDRYRVIPEGIDLEPVRAARAALTGAGPGAVTPVVADLQDAIAALGPERRALPLVVSVGRVVEVKGMARIVEAFAADPDLLRRANLVIVGGDLDDPSPAERAEIERIETVFVDHPELAGALVLLGHRPHDEVHRVLALARAGLAPWIAPGGAYACGSRKEEFGLAIVEALAAGLPVVAPRGGGPASYVEDGITGLLVDTLDRAALGAAIRGALDLAGTAGRARRAERVVEERLTIGAMAGALIPVYAANAGAVGEAAGAANVAATDGASSPADGASSPADGASSPADAAATDAARPAGAPGP